MMLTNREQTMCLIACLGFGVWLSLWQDVFRIGRLLKKPSKLRLFTEDIVFAVTGGVALFLFALAVNSGNMRLGMLVATAVGFFICRQTAGRLIMAAAGRIGRLWPPIAQWLARLNRSICTGMDVVMKKIAFFSKKGLRRASVLLYNKNRK